jgi:tRNA modification GTPase
LLDELRALGAEIVPWRDMLSDLEPSPFRRRAQMELAQTTTLRTAAILLDQIHGALDVELVAIHAMLEGGKSSDAADRLAQLIRSASLGEHLTRPWRVAVAGAPNVGKSSLINRLVGYPRCVVAPMPGTTRDVVTAAIAVDGWPVELIDTAGQRESPDALERAGVKLARDAVNQADLTIWVIDAANPDPSRPPAAENVLVVRNKIDLVSGLAMDDGAIPVSALTGAGLDELLGAMSLRLVPSPPPPGAPIAFIREIAERLRRVANLLAGSTVHAAVDELRSLLRDEASGNPS